MERPLHLRRPTFRQLRNIGIGLAILGASPYFVMGMTGMEYNNLPVDPSDKNIKMAAEISVAVSAVGVSMALAAENEIRAGNK